jgi:aromatic-ring opening dioxygenase LigAB LigA subunit
MNDQPHYRFPPASAYRLNRCLFALKSDDAFRTRFLKDAPAAMREMGLGTDDTAALLRGDRDALVARGAHPYLVFMADLRLRMEREPVTFEYF